MKIAALYDIHGNLPALNAVLDELCGVKPDLIVIGGDIVSGPMPVQTLDRLLELGAQTRFIRAHRDSLAQLPEAFTQAVNGLGEVLFCHATPTSDEENTEYDTEAAADAIRATGDPQAHAFSETDVLHVTGTDRAVEWLERMAETMGSRKG